MNSKFVLMGLCLAAFSACHGGNSDAGGGEPPPPPPPPPATIQLGDPLEGLTEEELAAFERGREMFTKRFKPSEGLGPVYNATSCTSCHGTPVVGGTADLYRNFFVATYGFSPLFQTNLPGLISPVIPAFGSKTSPTFTLEGARATLPETINGLPVTSAQRNSIPIFGVGLFEFISNETILSNADPEDLDGDGISGRANADGAGMGRFGLKAQSNNIEFFTRAPLMNQMGITSDPFRGSSGTVSMEHGLAVQASSNPNNPTRDNDGVADPEISSQDLGDLIAFTRFLAPPQPREFDEAATRGEQLFETAGCAKCHIPELPSSRGPVRAYTDLLIHDMGPDLADNVGFGTPQSSPNDPPHTGTEFRSSPLWGISHSAPYLHDGRAPTLDDAIRLHGGEALDARDRYVGLTPAEREDILAFLRHL